MQTDLPEQPLIGRKIAVVEDEFLIARDICESIAQGGGEVIGPFPTVQQALAGFATAEPEAALLDLNLAGESSLPLAQYLAERRIPFVLLTGYGANMITEPVLRAAPTVAKPFDDDMLISQLLALLDTPESGH